MRVPKSKLIESHQFFSSQCLSPTRIDIGPIIQNLIFFFHEKRVRQYVMNVMTEHIQSEHRSSPFFINWGTFYVHEDRLKHELTTKFEHHLTLLTTYPNTIEEIIFSVCLSYNITSVHFISFVLEWTHGYPRLISFDAGSKLYPEGEKKIVPMVSSIIRTYLKKHAISLKRHHFGVCCKRFYQKRFGIQYTGENPRIKRLPADAFCQTWSLFFLSEWIRRRQMSRSTHCRESFVHQWCQIQPCHRWTFILLHFILPLMTTHAQLESWFYEKYGIHSQQHMCMLYDYLSSQFWIHSVQSCEKQKIFNV